MNKSKNNFSSAGQKDNAHRSDCYVEFTLRQKGGIAIDLTSKVETLYGDSIRALVVDAFSSLSIKHAHVVIDDRGALPFVIAARLESAVKRMLPACDRSFLPGSTRSRKPSAKNRLRRTRLYLPGNDPRFFLNASLHKPDCIILDLEDSVALSEKDSARLLVRNALRSVNFGKSECMVRINSGDLGLSDLTEIIPHGVETVLVPKCESADELAHIGEQIESLKKQNGVRQSISILPIIESAKGVVNAYEIATSSKLICALAIGLEDYCADIGVERTREGKESLFARGAIVNAACAAGIQPLDSVFSDVADKQALMASARESKSLGFKGIGCIHPRQVQTVHDAFAPRENEVAKAQQVVLAFEEAKRSGSGVIALGTKMVDMPVVLQAQQTISLAETLGMIASNWRAKMEKTVTTNRAKEDGNAELA